MHARVHGADASLNASQNVVGRTDTLLQTSDLHTNLFPWDSFSGKPDAKRGLAKVATLIKQAREANPDCTLLVDTGDTIQGTSLGTCYGLVDNTPRHRM